MNRFGRRVLELQAEIVSANARSAFHKAPGDPIDQAMIERVRLLRESEMPYRRIRALTGVSLSRISRIINRKGAFR